MANHLESLRGNPQGSPSPHNLETPKTRSSIEDFISTGQDPNTLEILGNPSSFTIALLREGEISDDDIVRYFKKKKVRVIIRRLLSDPTRHDLLVSDVQENIVDPEIKRFEQQRGVARNLLGGARDVMIFQRHLIRKARIKDEPKDEPTKSEEHRFLGEERFIEEYFKNTTFNEAFSQGVNSAKAIGIVKRVLRLGILDLSVEIKAKAATMNKVLKYELNGNVDLQKLEKLFEGEYRERWPKEEMVWRIMEIIDSKDITENPGKAWQEVETGLGFVDLLVYVAYYAQKLVGAKEHASQYEENNEIVIP